MSDLTITCAVLGIAFLIAIAVIVVMIRQSGESERIYQEELEEHRAELAAEHAAGREDTR
ncbi:hypothetical protein [Azospirillum rugosum]|uniref:Uncharacterized protein n=1 Tax=Azospirillum rugosum TaxID=416170 RepID=A0ABS4SEY4_9PROT|nr:hypothetical protein [Azospirillum rugosum]MBP2291057.1 hypothetical protein [Azospirillum rugosum]MDQ0524879.1 hypothetical protein [Azospirillum rugosum]